MCLHFSFFFFFFKALRKRGLDNSLASIRLGWISVERPLAICVVWAAVTFEANALYINRFWWPESAQRKNNNNNNENEGDCCILLLLALRHGLSCFQQGRVWLPVYCLHHGNSPLSASLGKERIQRLACSRAFIVQADRWKPRWTQEEQGGRSTAWGTGGASNPCWHHDQRREFHEPQLDLLLDSPVI